MVVAGPCLYTRPEMKAELDATAADLRGVADVFRCKLWGGGTSVERYNYGIGWTGLSDLTDLSRISGLPVATEIHVPEQYVSKAVDHYWVGARNSSNYSLLKFLAEKAGEVWVKRAPGMTVAELCGIYDIVTKIHGARCMVIERGINTFCRTDRMRWVPDIQGAIVIKHERPDVFNNYMVDCSHSAGQRWAVADIYRAFQAIGVRHFMFECWHDPSKAETDRDQAISVEDLKSILGRK